MRYFRDECVFHGYCVSMCKGEKGDPGLMGLSGARGPMGPKVSDPVISCCSNALIITMVHLCIFYLLPRACRDIKEKR